MKVVVNANISQEGRAQTKDSYIQALGRFGCKPEAFNPFEDRPEIALSGAQALLLIGGPDVDPATYNRGRHSETKTQRESILKVHNDFLLIHEAIKRDIPILGICAGMQTLGIYFGAPLFQHIPEAGSDLVHQTQVLRHDVMVYGKLTQVFKSGNCISVNSRHHQCVEYVPKDMVVEARSSEGIIEAIRHKRLPIVGVQWHPEDLVKEAPSHNLFESFLNSYRRK